MTPDGWRLVGLLDVADIASGQVDPRILPYRDWPLVAPNHIEEGTGRLLPAPSAAEQGAISGKYMFSPGDVLYSKIRPYLRKVALPRFSGLCSADMYPLRSKGAVEPAFLFALLLSRDFTDFATSVSMRTGIPKINREELAKFQCALPPLGEQRKIAGILASVDEAIHDTQAVIDQLGVVKKAMMAELLMRGLPGRHARLKQTEIGDVPEGWEVRVLSDLGQVQTGVAKGKAVENGIELPYLRVANVQDGHVDLSELRLIAVDRSFVERYRLRAGDVLFTEGGDADKLGRGCVWYGQIDPCLHQNHVFAVRPNTARLIPEFLAAWAASDVGKAYFLGCAKQTTNLASINSTQLKALPVPMPTLDEQREIVSCLGSVTARIRAEGAGLNALRAAKVALMSVLLIGEVRVKPDEDAA